MAEQDTFGSLLAGLRQAPGVLPKLRVLGGGARLLRRLSPRERGVLLKMAGLGGAEALIEHLATGDQETERAFRRLLKKIEERPEELKESIRGLLDPARRAEAASALIHNLDEALNPEESEAEEEPAETEPQAHSDVAPGEATHEPTVTPPEPETPTIQPAREAAGPAGPPGPAAAEPANTGTPPGPPHKLPPPLPSTGPPGPPPPPRPRPEPPAKPAAELQRPPEPEPEPRTELQLEATDVALPAPPSPSEPAETPASDEGPDPWEVTLPTSAIPTPDAPPASRGIGWMTVGAASAAGTAVMARHAPGTALHERADLDELLSYRRRLADGALPTLTELEDRLQSEAPTWTRRRTLQAWIGSTEASELVAGLDRLLALIADLPRPADRLWCLSALVRRHAWTDDEWQRIADLAGSPALLWRLEGLRLRTA